MVKVRFHARIQTKHRVQIPAWLLLRNQIRVGDVLHVNMENVGVVFDTRVGTDFRVVIPQGEYEAIDGYWLRQPVLAVTLEFEERPDAQFAQAVLEKI
jgi:hypothetical protein